MAKPTEVGEAATTNKNSKNYVHITDKRYTTSTPRSS